MKRGTYVPSPPCIHCGMVDHHVNHHDAEARATGPHPTYYEQAGIVYHPYEPVRRPATPTPTTEEPER